MGNRQRGSGDFPNAGKPLQLRSVALRKTVQHQTSGAQNRRGTHLLEGVLLRLLDTRPQFAGCLTKCRQLRVPSAHRARAEIPA